MLTASATAKLSDVLTAAQLPALPHSAITLLQLSQNPDNGPAQYAAPIEADPGLLGQVLKFVNSSYFGFSREIGSVHQALTLVGSRAITNFALWSAVFSLVPNPKFGAFDLKSLWQDSLRRGVFARELGRVLKLRNAEDLFAGALLQDMAIPLLLKELPTEYDVLLEVRETNKLRLSTLERVRFGWDHAEAAGVLARKWNLPEEFAGLMERHTQLDELLATGTDIRGHACVALAALLPCCSDATWSEQPLFVDGFRQIAGPAIDLKSLMQTVDEQVEQFAPLLKLPVPRVKLADLV
ncbi:MAG: HDOD domain-containing protein [Pirellulaceae bacterium]